MKDIFCTNCAATTPHKGYIDQNGEFVFECQTKDCKAFVKFPAVTDKKELEAHIEGRTKVNQPIAEKMQSTREQQAILSEILSDGTEVKITASDPSSKSAVTK